MEYIILTDSYISRLESDVNKYIKDGWSPQGGVSISMTESDHFCAQAMVKEEGGA
jgi:hypothetical protein